MVCGDGGLTGGLVGGKLVVGWMGWVLVGVGGCWRVVGF